MPRPHPNLPNRRFNPAFMGFQAQRRPTPPPEASSANACGSTMRRTKKQIATADCYQNNPGTFRLVLKPGRYVVHGPGGVKPIDVKDAGWVKIESIAVLPVAP